VIDFADLAIKAHADIREDYGVAERLAESIDPSERSSCNRIGITLPENPRGETSGRNA